MIRYKEKEIEQKKKEQSNTLLTDSKRWKITGTYPLDGYYNILASRMPKSDMYSLIRSVQYDKT